MDAARCQYSPVSAEFNVVGWEDFDGNRFDGEPGDVTQSWGMLVHAHDDETGDDLHFWAFVPYTFDDWDSWYEYIESLIDMYGLSVS